MVPRYITYRLPVGQSLLCKRLTRWPKSSRTMGSRLGATKSQNSTAKIGSNGVLIKIAPFSTEGSFVVGHNVCLNNKKSIA